MNKSIKKCCVCNNKRAGEFIMINNNKYHVLCIEKLRQENQELKKQLSNSRQIKNQQKEFIEYLEAEKDRLAKECSDIYEDSLGKILYVNEDIYNEVNKILSKYKEIIGGEE